MLVPQLALCVGHLHWLSFIIACLGFVGVYCLPAEPPIIFSYDDSTPFPAALKCYTCDSTKDNNECNRKAYDAFCPEGTKYCYTSHHFNHLTMESIVVTKMCATQGECTPSSVGCLDMNYPDLKQCISCCEGTKCNDEVPMNSTTAIFTTITPYSHATAPRSSRSVTALSLLLTATLVRGWLWT